MAMAEFCIHYGVQPSEFMNLTLAQKSTFNAVARRIRDQQKGG